jgi:hypothetical protein
MQDYGYGWFQLKIILKLLGGCGLAFIALLSLSPAQALAYSGSAPARNLTLQLDVGFNSFYRIGYWTPVRVTVSNQGADFSGTLAINTFSGLSPISGGSNTSPWSFEEPVTVPQGTQKQFTLTMPLYMGLFPPHGITAKLLDTHGHAVTTQQAVPEYLNPGDILVGIFSDNYAGFSPLSAVTLPNSYSSVVLAPLDATTMPTTTTVLSNFDVIVLDDFATTTLSPAQVQTLQAWVNQGGALIEVGGTAWQRTLKALPPELSPVIVNGTDVIPAGTQLLPVGSAAGQPPDADTLQEPLAISTATVRTQAEGFTSEAVTLQSSGTTPLLVQVRHGQGLICYLAFDPALQPLVNWSAINTFWKSLLIRATGDHALIGNTPEFSSGPGQILVRGGILQILQPPPLLSPWIIGLLFLAYIVIIGPARILIVRRLKRPELGWRIIVSSIVIFSLMSYGLSLYQRRASLLDNSISIVQINADGSPAHITTYHGIFAPNESNIQLYLPGNGLALPNPSLLVPGSPIFSQDDPYATITPVPGGTNMHLPNDGIWPFHAFVSEQDRQLQGGITAHLTLQNNRLVGSITNTLDASLNDVYVLMPHNFVFIGHLSDGQTLQVDLPLHGALSRPGPSINRGATTLADAIAASNGLRAPYFPYDQNQQPGNDFQRHVAILSALSGAGFSYGPCGAPCITHDIVSKGAILTTPPGTPLNINFPGSGDPLLLNGASATLIGWADTPLDAINDVTVDGLAPYGFHDNLVQAALAIDFSGSSNVPLDTVTGYLVDEQDSDAEDTVPNTYSLSTGSVTFEFTLPNLKRAQINSLTLMEPNSLGNTNLQTVAGPKTDPIQAQLYNWQTLSWDSIALTAWTFTTTNTAAYIGPDGRVLLQIANANPAGLLIFGKPSLSLKGNSTGQALV